MSHLIHFEVDLTTNSLKLVVDPHLLSVGPATCRRCRSWVELETITVLCPIMDPIYEPCVRPWAVRYFRGSCTRPGKMYFFYFLKPRCYSSPWKSMKIYWSANFNVQYMWTSTKCSVFWIWETWKINLRIFFQWTILIENISKWKIILIN